jgi:pyruvate formate lyase activating enzyme
MKGLIFSVKRYSVHDGPGIRVTFFMKGCPLQCKWCHNPEGISPDCETVTRINRIGDKEFKTEERVGELYSVEAVLSILEKEKVFINHSKGGVTFSGGEPMMQIEFLLDALKACKLNGYHTAVDTSGYSSVENIKSILPYTDLFLYDLKHLDGAKHLQATGVSNIGILNNLGFLLDNNREVMLRIPVIPGFNDDAAYQEKLVSFITSMKAKSLKKIHLLPYHKIGSSKYKKFKMQYNMEGIEPPDKSTMHSMKELLLQTGIKVKIGG